MADKENAATDTGSAPEAVKQPLPPTIAGGLEGAPAFLLANDAEIREAYRAELTGIATVLKFANEAIHMYAVGSDRWLIGARMIDAVRDATDIHGWTGARRARMFLLQSVDDAVHHDARRERYQKEIRVLEDLGTRRDLDQADRQRFNAAAKEVGPNFSSYRAERPFREVAKRAPSEAPSLFAAFLFRRRCPQFARGLVTPEALAALQVLLTSWARSRGRPKKGDARPPKWEAADVLMKAAGLVGRTSDSLEADWKAWLARQNRGLPGATDK